MIRGLLRRDPLLGEPAAFIKISLIGIAVSNGAALWAALGTLRGNAHPLMPGSLEYAIVAAVTWLILARVLLAMRATVRCTPLDLALPVPHRRVWLARTAVTLAAALVLPVCAALVLVLVNRVNRVPVPVTRSALTMMLTLYGGAVLAVAMLHRYHPRESAPPMNARFARYFALVAAGILAAILVLTAISPWLCALLGAAGVALLAITYRALPPAFALFPREAEIESARAVAAPVSAGTIRPLRFVTARALYEFESSFGWAFAVLPLLAIYGVLMGIDAGAFSLVQVTWVWMLALLVPILPLSRLYRLDPLPLARRRIFPWIALPLVLVPVLAYSVTRVWDEIRPGRGSPVACRWIEEPGRAGRCGIAVPERYWAIAGGGAPPPAVAPGGETRALAALSISRGLRATAFNPYQTPEGSTPEFVAWQLSRAIRAVHGRAISPEELQRRYLVRRPDGSAAWVAGPPSLRRDFPELAPPIVLRALPLAALATGLPILLLLAWLMGPLGEARDASFRRRLSVMLIAGPLALTALFLFGVSKTAFETRGIFAAASVLLRRFTDSPAGHPALLWTVAAALLALGYGVAQRAFDRVEATGPRASW